MGCRMSAIGARAVLAMSSAAGGGLSRHDSGSLQRRNGSSSRADRPGRHARRRSPRRPRGPRARPARRRARDRPRHARRAVARHAVDRHLAHELGVRRSRPPDRARRPGRHLGRRDRGCRAVRPGAGLGHERHRRRHRLHVRRRPRLPLAQARTRRRQPDPCRCRDRRRRDADRARGPPQRPVLGAARGGRELRRGDLARVQAAPGARGLRRHRPASTAGSRRTCWRASASTPCRRR